MSTTLDILRAIACELDIEYDIFTDNNISLIKYNSEHKATTHITLTIVKKHNESENNIVRISIWDDSNMIINHLIYDYNLLDPDSLTSIHKLIKYHYFGSDQ